MQSLEGKLPTTEITKNDIHQLRLITSIGFIANLIWGFFPEQLAPTWGLAPFHHGLTFICFLCAWASFFMPLTIQRIEVIKFIEGFALCSHSIFAVAIHQNALDDVITAAICLMLVSSIFEKKKWSLVFSLALSVEIAFFLFYNTEYKTTPTISMMWFILVAIGYGTAASRIEKQERTNFNLNFISSLIGQMTEGVVVHDFNGTIIKMNKAAESILETPLSKFMSDSNHESMWSVFHEDGRPLIQDMYPSIVSLKENKTVIAFPLVLERKDTGEKKFLEVNSVPIYTTSQHRAEFALVTITDKTKFKNAESDLNRQREIIIQTNKLSALGEMAAGIAHEINNPLTISLTRLLLIKKRVANLDIDCTQILADIDLTETTLGRIGKIIKNMKTFVRNGTQDPFTRESLNGLIQNVLDISTIGIKRSGITVSFKENCQTSLNCNTIEIEQVLINFLQNSADAIKNLPEKWIEVRLFEDTRYAYISITDSGLGIPAHILEKMNEPFFTTKQIGKGTGMGLSISRSIVQRHQGSIQYVSDSKNTQFIISLKKNLEIENSAAA